MRKGFTLIELLVVIAIIAILAGILFPVFARARAKAKQTQCLNNVKQLQLGMIMYASDYDGCNPSSDANTLTGALAWQLAIQPYVKNWDIVLCPDDNLPFDVAGTVNPVRRSGYGMNLWMSGMPESYIVYPVNAMGIMDAKVGSIDALADLPIPPRHNDGSNISFVDGHAKWMKTQSVPDPANQDPATQAGIDSKKFWQGID